MIKIFLIQFLFCLIFTATCFNLHIKKQTINCTTFQGLRKKNRINHLLWHTARNGEIGEFDLDLFQPFLAVEAVDVVNAGDVDGKIPWISWRLYGPIPGTIADDPHITSWRKDHGNSPKKKELQNLILFFLTVINFTKCFT